MAMTRRDFVRVAGGAAGVVAIGGLALPAFGRTGKAEKPLRVLVLGGTGFIGPHIVRNLVDRGHTVTLFNRGRRNDSMFPDLEARVGDRTQPGGLDALKEGEWDAVIDTWPSVPRYVREAGEALKGRAGWYLFVSTVSVYSSYAEVGMDESGPLATTDDPTAEQVTGANYGALKVLCENAAMELFPGAATVVRPGLIVGPGDPTDRFTYWPVRVRDGGKVLAPGEPTNQIQVIDGRDLAKFIVKAVEDKSAGIFNATGLPTEMGDVLFDCETVTDSGAEFVWGSAEFLEKQQVAPWSDMPAWVPPKDDYAGFGSMDVSKAIGAGMTLRPLTRTIVDLLAWWDTLPEERRAKLGAGITRDREAGLVKLLADTPAAP